MDNKKIVTVAVLAVLALAFAGYGYASYTASTYNEGNNVAVNYITVTPSGWEALTGDDDAMEINTWTYGGQYDICYAFQTEPDAADAELAEAAGYGADDNPVAVQVGEAYTLTITDNTGEDWETYTLDITNADGTIVNSANSGFKLFLKINDEYVLVADSMTATVDSETVDLSLWIVANYDIQNEPFPGEDDGISGSSVAPTGGKILDDVTFVFKVTGATLAA